MNYLDLGLDYLYMVLRSKNTSNQFYLSPGIGFSYGHLLSGFQYIDNEKYSLIETGAFSRNDFMFRGIIQAKFNLGKSFYLLGEYRFSSSLKQIEKINSGESTKNIYQGFLIGLGINLNKEG